MNEQIKQYKELLMNGFRTNYTNIESYMLSQMSDSAHDAEHVYRVLNYALGIARFEPTANRDVLITACLLHDIARAEQFADSAIDHATYGAEKAFAWLTANGYAPDFAEKVRDCISTHRYRSNNPPMSIEAKILFDADKIEVCGAIGMVRTINYTDTFGRPLYTLDPDGSVNDGADASGESVFREYHRKLKHVYDRFYTARGRELGEKRRTAMTRFYEDCLAEISECYQMHS
jgi:uncharacterized protein